MLFWRNSSSLDLTHDTIGVKQPGTIALDVEGLMFSRDFLLRQIFVFEWHKFFISRLQIPVSRSHHRAESSALLALVSVR